MHDLPQRHIPECQQNQIHISKVLYLSQMPESWYFGTRSIVKDIG